MKFSGKYWPEMGYFNLTCFPVASPGGPSLSSAATWPVTDFSMTNATLALHKNIPYADIALPTSAPITPSVNFVGLATN